MKAIYENHYLSDRDVANFARQSFAKLADHFSTEQNNQLIRFLARGMASNAWERLLVQMTEINSVGEAHELARYIRSIPEHWAPFAHPHITLRMQAPVPIARQCFKHKIGQVESEESRRYIKSRPKLFMPLSFRAAAENVKQGSAGPHHAHQYWREVYFQRCEEMIDLYERAIGDGVCPEQARFFLPQGVEVNWVWTGSLYAFANFVIQRKEAHAQQEIQDLAEQVDQIIAPLYPVSWEALTKGLY